MGKIRFNIRNPKSDSDTPVYMIYQEKGPPLVYPSGLYVLPKNWDFDKYKIKGKSAIVKKSNEQLDLYRLELQTILLDMKRTGERFTKAKAKAALDRKFNIVSINDVTIFGFAETIHNRLKGTINKDGLPRILLHIERFDKTATFEDIDNDFYERFTKYLFELNFVRITINKILTELKRLWQLASEEGITKNPNLKIIKKFKTYTDHVALELKDVKVLYDYQITEKHLNYDIGIVQEIKNRFLLGCFTGLRISDWNKIQKSNIETIEGESMFVISTQKTDVICAIPVNIFPFTKVILDSYPDELPILTKRNFNIINRVLKDICQKAGLNRITDEVVWKRQKTTIQKRLFERVSPHTSRRTFVTTLLNKGYSENEIKKMTGHKSAASFSQYDKQKAVENAVNISKTNNRKLKAI